MTTIRLFSILAALGLLTTTAFADDAAGDLVPLKPKLPAPAFVGTPKDVPAGANIEAPSNKPAPPLMIPRDALNIAPTAMLSCSDTNAKPQMLAKVTDGIKEADDANLLLLKKGAQYLQFDFGSPRELFALVLWHAHDTPKIYHGVVVQIADDPVFKTHVRTLFNNDSGNVVKRGMGKDREYFETYEGKTIDLKGDKARCVRLYSKGSTDSSLNEYTEVEIYGRTVK